MAFHDLTSCDLHQLSDFILALELDIHKWRHIWVAINKLHKEQACKMCLDRDNPLKLAKVLVPSSSQSSFYDLRETALPYSIFGADGIDESTTYLSHEHAIYQIGNRTTNDSNREKTSPTPGGNYAYGQSNDSRNW